MSLPATIHDVEVLGDGDVVVAHRVRLAIGENEVVVHDNARLLGPDTVGEEHDVVLAVFFSAVESVATLDAGITSTDAGVVFEGTVSALDAGHEGFVATLDVGLGTIRFDPGGRPTVAPGDAVRVESETVHLVAVE